jgi:HD-like signal output (HDOD) protein
VNIITKPLLRPDGLAAVRRELAALIEHDRLDLPALPVQVARSIGMAIRAERDTRALARLVASDRWLAARVMRVARAGTWPPDSPMPSLPRAIHWLGVAEVNDIVLTAAAGRELLSWTGPRARVTRAWQQSVACAIWSREVAAMARCRSPLAYLCGLMHDAGRSVALLIVADLAGKLGVGLSDDDYDALVHQFHGELGLLLAQRWQLPEAVVACMLHWREPQAAGSFTEEAKVVHIAHHVAELVIGQGPEMARAALRTNPGFDALNIGPDRLKALIDRTDWVMGQVRAY